MIRENLQKTWIFSKIFPREKSNTMLRIYDSWDIKFRVQIRK